jgi:hypothetical protein
MTTVARSHGLDLLLLLVARSPTQTSRSSSVVRITGIALGWIGPTAFNSIVTHSRSPQCERCLCALVHHG